MKKNFAALSRKVSKWVVAPLASVGLIFGAVATPAHATIDPSYANLGLIDLVQSGNSIDWETWVDAASIQSGNGSLDYGRTADVFVCLTSTVTLSDCIGYDPLQIAAISAEANFVAATSSFSTTSTAGSTGMYQIQGTRSLELASSGVVTPSSMTWVDSPDVSNGNNITLNSTYKAYLVIWDGSIPGYWASNPFQLEFRTPSATPTISTHPVDASKTVGDALSLSVTAAVSGSGTLSYQWKKDGNALSGATSASLSIPSVAIGDAGSYTVDVTNTETGNAPTTVTSNAAVVTVAAAASGGGSGSDDDTEDVASTGSSISKSFKKSVAFTSGSRVLSKSTKSAIKAAVKKAGKKAKFTVTGTAGLTAGVPQAYTKNLATLRAKAVKAYLVKLGVAKKNIKIKAKVLKSGVSPKTKLLAKYTVS